MSLGTAVSVWAKIKVVLFPEIGREKFFYHSPSRVSEYIFNFKKRTNKQKEIRILKKETKEEKRISQKSRLKKTNLRQSRWRFFSGNKSLPLYFFAYF